MNTTLVESEAVALLSRITGRSLNQKDLTPPVVFLAALVTVLLGVIDADTKTTQDEMQRLLTSLYRFSNPDSNVRRLTHLMIKGVRENKINERELEALTKPFSEPEKLLLITFGYDMSAADGNMDIREKKYLEVIAKKLEINSRYFAVLEAGFTDRGYIDPVALDEVKFLLTPARFQSLDIVFVKAASDILMALPGKAKAEHKVTQQRLALPYKELQQFQEYRQQLETTCAQLAQIIQDGINCGILSDTLAKEVEEIGKKLKSQRFRLAVVGEFSQGKSTLLNALLGEEIQPVREIPCSGTVTVLRYGAQKRVVCCYKDGREQEIPFDQYQEKAAISEDAALGCLSDELVNSEIDEIIFEHPDLELCSNGVEIVDSPGLNEHPDRTAITQKLVKDTDAVIFLTNASRSLTEGERDLLQDLKTQLNGGKQDQPADKLFVVGNFMDLVRTEKGLQQVQQRIERFVQGQNPIVAGKNRVHFISAQEAINAIKDGIENEYVKKFQDFTQSLEKFLTLERGYLEIEQSASKINGLIKASLNNLALAEDTLDRKIKDSEAKKQKSLEEIGEASGGDVRIRILAKQLTEQSFDQAVEAWDEWADGLSKRITNRSKNWYSEHNPALSQDKLIKDYINQFTKNLSQEIEEWGNKKLNGSIIKPKLKQLDEKIAQELKAIQREFMSVDQQFRSNLSEQLKFSISNGISDDFMGVGGFGGGLGVGGALAGGLMLFTGIGLVALILASVAAAIASSFGLGMLDVDGLHNKIKLKVCELGLKEFDKSKDKFKNKLNEIINSVFDKRVELASQVIAEAISLYENLLNQQGKNHQKMLEQCEVKKALIAQKRQKIEQGRIMLTQS